MSAAEGPTSSYLSRREIVAAGDEVVLYSGKDSVQLVGMEFNGTFQNRYGRYRHNDIIGKPYGSTIYNSDNRGRTAGFVKVLHPSAELWTETLPHRTQILYAADIAMVLSMLELRPGSVVIESGTGSGSLTHALARAVSPGGHVYTFDFHQGRVETAREEFRRHGLDHVVTAAHADATRDGFGLEGVADAVFLDLPAPEKAIPFALKAMKRRGGRICTFCPCIEQVQNSADALRKARCTDVQTFETLERYLEPIGIYMSEVDLTPIPVGAGNVPPASRVQASRSGAKPKHADDEEEEEGAEVDEESGAPPAKRAATQRGGDGASGREKTRVVVPRRVAKGHTGYLTFATVLHPEALSGGSEGQARAAAALKEAAAEASGEAAAAEDTGEAAAPAADAET